MAARLVSMNCPSCGAKLDAPSDRKEFYCSYCGSKVLLDDGSYTVTHRIIDDARVIKAKAEAETILGRFGLGRTAVRVALVVCVIVVVGAVLMGIIGALGGDKDAFFPLVMMVIMAPILIDLVSDAYKRHKRAAQRSAPLEEGKARLPISASAAESADVHDVVAQLEAAGFTNVGTMGMGDVNIINSKFVRDGRVSGMVVDGDEDAESGIVLPTDARIVIMYHSRS